MISVAVLLVLSLTLVSCEQPPQVVVEQPVPAEPATEEEEEAPVREEPQEENLPVEEPQEDEPPVEPEAVEEEPVWEPDPHTIYILDADGGVYLSRVVSDPDRWPTMTKSWRTTVELYNRDMRKPGPYPYEFVAGEAP